MTHAFRYGRKVAALVAGISWLVLAAPACVRAAATIQVPTDFPTIQAAINAAADGDTIVVSPGTYFEQIDFLGKAITVESSQGPSSTIIDGSNAGSVVTFINSEGPQSVLHGFTIQHGFAPVASGGGVNIRFASPTIDGNVITNNVSDGFGGGIFEYFGSPRISNNTITNNSTGFSGGTGGGIDFNGASAGGGAQIIGNTISGNTSDFGGGIILGAAGTAIIEDNIIQNNFAGTYGGGIYMLNQSGATAIMQNLITGNQARAGGGMALFTGTGVGSLLLTGNTMAGNTAIGSGPMIWLEGGSLSDTEFFNNIGVDASSQAALFCDTTVPDQPLFDHNDFYGSTGTVVGGICAAPTGANGNISADPAFMGATDFRLQPTSPAIDAGNDLAPNLPSIDLAGNPRIIGAAVDIGAYEAPLSLGPGPVANLSAVWGPQQSAIISWTAPEKGPVTSYILIESPDGTTESVDAGITTATVSRLKLDNTYTFTVVATNSAGNGPPMSVTLLPRSGE